MIHDQFMGSEYQRKRYWGRGMVGWRHFDNAEPNVSIETICLSLDATPILYLTVVLVV
jgi:hypothetical protein